MLKITKVEFELITDPDIFMFFGKGRGGGISFISNTHRKSKKKYLKSYRSKQESKHSIYLDTNNLYDYAMSKFFPKKGFEWINPKMLDFNRYNSNSSEGCVLEVDLEYPKELRKLYNDYPLVPDKIEMKI